MKTWCRLLFQSVLASTKEFPPSRMLNGKRTAVLSPVPELEDLLAFLPDKVAAFLAVFVDFVHLFDNMGIHDVQQLVCFVLLRTQNENQAEHCH